MTAPSMGTPPEMTDTHVAVIFERAQRRGQEPFSERMLDEIEANVRSQASGTHVLADTKTQFVGDRDEAQNILAYLTECAEGRWKPGRDGFEGISKSICRWLAAGTPDTKTEPR